MLTRSFGTLSFTSFLVVVIHFAEQTDGAGSDLRLVVESGVNAILPCRETRIRRSSGAETNWTRNGQPLDTETGGRIGLSSEGHLLLRSAMEEDSGVYVCKVKGNGGISEVNVTLIVLVPDAAPYFTNITEPNVTLERYEGSDVIFRCPVKGHPLPQVTWNKDGVDISDPMARDPDTQLVQKNFSIILKNIRLSSSGNYTCSARNDLGAVDTTFHLRVITKEKNSNNSSRPDLAVFHPLNTTVKYGSSATFQCRVRSEAPPNIQWLKKVDYTEGQHDLIKVQGESYRILQSSQVEERSDGSFLNKLTIPEVYEADSGKYICLGANAMGYSYRSAYLTVLPRPHALPLGWERSVAAHPGRPSSLLVAIPITLGVLVGFLVALVVLCHRRKSDLKDERAQSDAALDVGVERLCCGETADDLQLDCVHSEVELGGSGTTVTRICEEHSSSGSCDGCFGTRNEV